MSKRNNDLLVEDIISAFKAILDYTSGMSYDDFIDSRITVDAVIRNFEIIGKLPIISTPISNYSIRKLNGES